MTSWARASSRSTRARITWRIWSSTRPPMASSVCFSVSISSWKCRCMARSLTEPAGDVVFGLLVPWIGEQLPRHAEFHQLAQEHKARVVAHAGRLLHVVRDDHDGIAVLELEHELLDLGGGDGIEGGAGLVHQEHVRLDSDGPRDAQALLLAPGHAERRLLEPVVHLVPQCRRPQAPFHDPFEVGPVRYSEDAGPVGDILEDGLRERI